MTTTSYPTVHPASLPDGCTDPAQWARKGFVSTFVRARKRFERGLGDDSDLRRALVTHWAPVGGPPPTGAQWRQAARGSGMVCS